MKIAIVVNCHVSAVPGEPHGFDHPTPLADFAAAATLPGTVASLAAARKPEGCAFVLYVFALAVDGSAARDAEIRAAVEPCLAASGLEYRLVLNGDVLAAAEAAAPQEKPFFSVAGYPEIRNLGLQYPVREGADGVVQIDDDELVPAGYLVAAADLLRAHPDKHLFTAPYMKKGTIRIRTRDDLASWPKFSSMDADMARLEGAREPVPTLFGFGGNMIVRSAFARAAYYPLGVPRGEDFSLLLAARLLRAAGDVDRLPAGDDRFVAWFVDRPELTIDHRPPVEAKKDFLYYLEKNLRRFGMEWLMLRGQDAFKAEDLPALSHYLHAMLAPRDFPAKVREIYAELRSRAGEDSEIGRLLPAAVDESEGKVLAAFEAERAAGNRFAAYLEGRRTWEALFG